MTLNEMTTTQKIGFDAIRSSYTVQHRSFGGDKPYFVVRNGASVVTSKHHSHRAAALAITKLAKQAVATIK